MNDQRDGFPEGPLRDDELGELIRNAGHRDALPELELAAIRAKTCAAWEREHGATYPWVAAMRDWRKSNALFEKSLGTSDFADAEQTMTGPRVSNAVATWSAI